MMLEKTRLKVLRPYGLQWLKDYGSKKTTETPNFVKRFLNNFVKKTVKKIVKKIVKKYSSKKIVKKFVKKICQKNLSKKSSKISSKNHQRICQKFIIPKIIQIPKRIFASKQFCQFYHFVFCNLGS